MDCVMHTSSDGRCSLVANHSSSYFIRFGCRNFVPFFPRTTFTACVPFLKE